jgi:hypothetical protein
MLRSVGKQITRSQGALVSLTKGIGKLLGFAAPTTVTVVTTPHTISAPPVLPVITARMTVPAGTHTLPVPAGTYSMKV